MISIDLSGHIAVVTGAAGELGRTMARTLARAGADVVVHYHNSREKAESVVADITAMGRKSIAVSADVTDLNSVLAMKDKINSTLGPTDIVVANAVSQYKWTTILEQDPADFTSQFASCTLHLVHLAKAFAPDMIEAKKGGRFIGINTECSALNNAGQAAYSAAKRGMDGIARTLAKELGPHQITVNQVAPGWMISDRQRGTAEEKQPGYDKHVPLGRRGYDQDIANAVTFLASDLAVFINGIYLPVSGGTVMPGI
jgi:3-oxoacyl-[acyl-carrier protein] reductase